MKTVITTMMFLVSMMTRAQIDLSDSTQFVGQVTQEWADITTYMRKAMRFDMEVPQEKVYLHFDNTGYFKGETMWFKAYVVRANDQKATDISSVLYVDLLTPGGDVLQTKKLYVEDGQARGEFKLDSIYETGFFEVRAYTRYMMNWGGAAAFSRVFPVFTQPKTEGDYSVMEIDKHSYKHRMPSYRALPTSLVTTEVKKSGKKVVKLLPKGDIHVNFYPEGGWIVEDVPCRVAFTVNDSEGRYFDTEGALLNADKEVIHGAMTYKNGRGFIEVTSDGEPLYLHLTTADGKEHDFALPEARPEGVSMMLNAVQDDRVTATLTSSPSMHGSLLGYVLMHGGRIIMADTLTCMPRINLTFDRETLPAGVSQLTVFDSNGTIHSERLFFICPKLTDADSIHVSTAQAKLSPCGKVTIDIKAEPHSMLSFSAMDMATLTNGKNLGNSRTWMLLSSELKGFIESPEYYFEADDREHRIDADMLMMVQGWRRYDWNLMSGQTAFANIEYIEDSLYIFGQIKDKRKDKLEEGVNLHVWLYHKSGCWVHGETVTDSVGYYAFRLPNMSGDWNMLMKTKKDDQYINTRVCINRHFAPQSRWLSPYETEAIEPMTANLFADVPDSAYDEDEEITILKRENVIPTVRVKAFRRIYDNARAAWETEKQAQKYACIRYDMDAETDRLYDAGEAAPGIYDWLFARNNLFTAASNKQIEPTDILENTHGVIIDGRTYDELRDESILSDAWRTHGDADIEMPDLVGATYETTSNAQSKYSMGYNGHRSSYTMGRISIDDRSRDMLRTTFYDTGLGYKDRPIVWILNNTFSHVTSSNGYNLGRTDILLPNTREDFPTYIDEVKAIYISEAPNAYKSYLVSDGLAARSAVTVYVYTHHRFWQKVKGLRRTHFHAFDDPETFEMTDYSALPPMEDFRRTIYWNPDVRTDAAGRARLEFYNNSSARKLYISAEGMTKDGRFLSNE